MSGILVELRTLGLDICGVLFDVSSSELYVGGGPALGVKLPLLTRPVVEGSLSLGVEEEPEDDADRGLEPPPGLDVARTPEVIEVLAESKEETVASFDSTPVGYQVPSSTGIVPEYIVRVTGPSNDESKALDVVVSLGIIPDDTLSAFGDEKEFTKEWGIDSDGVGPVGANVCSEMGTVPQYMVTVRDCGVGKVCAEVSLGTIPEESRPEGERELEMECGRAVAELTTPVAAGVISGTIPEDRVVSSCVELGNECGILSIL